MFKLLRNKKVMKLVVGFVALSFLGGFVGSYAVRSLGQINEPEPQQNAFAEELSNTIGVLEGDLEYYSNAISEEPDNANYYILLADTNYDLAGLRSGYLGEDVTGYLTEARDNYKLALELDEGLVNLLLSIGMVETALGDFEEAAIRYETFLAEYPNSFEANALYTQMLVLAENKDQAEEWLEKTRELAGSEEELQIVEQLEGLVNPS